MIEGSCLCGDIRWRVSGELTPPSHCHCSMCRKANGTAFFTVTSCAREDFEWVAGEDRIVTYASSDRLSRPFCPTCGSGVPLDMAGEAEVEIPLGPVEGDPGVSGGRHIFVASKAPWYEIGDDLPQHDAYPEEDFEVARPDPGPPPEGVTRGSCLCGGVAFELSEPFAKVYNCHCSRCRKARASAHATNGFVPIDALRFTRGEHLIAEYKLPEADVFAQAFCTRCGSAVPRRRPANATASVPFGALDDAPGKGPEAHIFVGSRAPWVEIGDDLPRHEEGPDS